jgi:hypothetical protein
MCFTMRVCCTRGYALWSHFPWAWFFIFFNHFYFYFLFFYSPWLRINFNYRRWRQAEVASAIPRVSSGTRRTGDSCYLYGQGGLSRRISLMYSTLPDWAVERERERKSIKYLICKYLLAENRCEGK